jgi:hypothetical protein
MNKQEYTISDYFCSLVKKAGSPKAFAQKHCFDSKVVEKYYNKTQSIQLTSLIANAAIMEFQRCQGRLLSKYDLKNAALLLIEEKDDFAAEWEKMFS